MYTPTEARACVDPQVDQAHFSSPHTPFFNYFIIFKTRLVYSLSLMCFLTSEDCINKINQTEARQKLR